jgi:hypothetical protein
VYLRPIDLARLEHVWDAPTVSLMAVGAELDSAAHPALEVVHERQPVLGRALPDEPRRHELCIGADRDPRPHIAITEGPLVLSRDVFLLCVAEPPHLVALNRFARQIDQNAVLIGGTSCTQVRQELGDRVLSGTSNADGRSNAVALHKTADDLGSLLRAQAVHDDHYA